MKTFIIQYYKKGNWYNVTDLFNCDVAFVSLNGAAAIVNELRDNVSYPAEAIHWRIKDSDQKIYPPVIKTTA